MWDARLMTAMLTRTKRSSTPPPVTNIAKGKYKNRYEELNAEVQRKLRVVKQQQLQGTCTEVEAANWKGNSRQLFNIVKSMTRKFQPPQFRLCVLAYRCLIGTAPSYLAETLHLTADVGSRRRLRSASKSTLVIPSTWRTTLCDLAFPVTAARARNALPSSVRSALSLLQFRRDLKTALFQSSYSSP